MPVYDTPTIKCLDCTASFSGWQQCAFVLSPYYLPRLPPPAGCFEGLFLSSCLTKIPEGGWVALLIGGILASVQITWWYGSSMRRNWHQAHAKGHNDQLLEAVLSESQKAPPEVGFSFKLHASSATVTPPQDAVVTHLDSVSSLRMASMCAHSSITGRVLLEQQSPVAAVAAYFAATDMGADLPELPAITRCARVNGHMHNSTSFDATALLHAERHRLQLRMFCLKRDAVPNRCLNAPLPYPGFLD